MALFNGLLWLLAGILGMLHIVCSHKTVVQTLWILKSFMPSRCMPTGGYCQVLWHNCNGECSIWTSVQSACMLSYFQQGQPLNSHLNWASLLSNFVILIRWRWYWVESSPPSKFVVVLVQGPKFLFKVANLFNIHSYFQHVLSVI